ncbi:MAG: sigma-54-dependent Fis family transcriptional regulator [Nitrospirae bacterium]|nr:sigma-54-dependent Fis family transcriptional regulator [Nitrospirota bacterium]
MMDKKVLLIDDDESISWVITRALKTDGYAVTPVNNASDGIEALSAGYPLIILDLKLPDMDGLEVLKKVKEVSSESSVIIITAHGGMEETIEAIKIGAYDYLEKPFDIEELKILLEKAIKDKAREDEIIKLRQAVSSKYRAPSMIGTSAPMLTVFKTIGKVAPKDVTVLITGESGTGKELVAKAIHYNSPRTSGHFIALNSASIPRDLLEAELFGYEKGAFTGAVERKCGKLEAADGGTLFLDEIGEMAPGLQAKFLRVLEEHEVTPLGGNKPVRINVRIIGATNKDLEETVRKGSFREDLFYRFNVVQIKLPPLRDRREDILPLARHFIRLSEEQINTGPKELSKEVEDYLMEYGWPGNVRELENSVKRACLLSQGPVLKIEDFDLSRREVKSISGFLEEKLKGFMRGIKTFEEFNLYDTVISEVEKALISMVLRETKGNQIKASKLLGINRNTLRKKINELRIKWD